MQGLGDLEVSGLRVSLEPSGVGNGIRPVIHGGEVTVPSTGFMKLARQFLSEGIEAPQVRLRFVSARLLDGGAEVVMKAKRGIVDQNVTLRVELAPAGNGDLRVHIADVRVGRLPAGWVLDLVLGAVERVDGLTKSGAKSIDVNLPALLASRDVPVQIAAGVSAVHATADSLTIRL